MTVNTLIRAEAYVVISPTGDGQGEMVIDIQGMLIDAIILSKMMGVPKDQFLAKCEELFEKIDVVEVEDVTPASPTMKH